MFGCFRRLISQVIFAVVVVAAFFTRDLWLPRVRAALGGSGTVTGTSADSAARARADTGWVSLNMERADRGRSALAKLRAPKGPAFVAVAAGDFAGAVLDSLRSQLPASTDSVQVRAEGNEFQVRAVVRLGDLGGKAVLGPLASMVGEREHLLLGGTIEPSSVAGVAQFRLTRVKVGDFSVPSPVIPRLVRAMKRPSAVTGVDASALPLRLPAGVGDIRVAQGRITLYRVTP